MQSDIQNNPGVIEAGAPELALQQQRVLRNTYFLLALTMVPTAIGAFIGVRTGGIIMQYPIVSFFVMLAAVIGLQFAIAANHNSSLGVVLLLAMTFILGWWLGPLLSIALTLKNGPQLIGMAAVGTGVIFFVMAGIATTVSSLTVTEGTSATVGVRLTSAPPMPVTVTVATSDATAATASPANCLVSMASLRAYRVSLRATDFQATWRGESAGW